MAAQEQSEKKEVLARRSWIDRYVASVSRPISHVSGSSQPTAGLEDAAKCGRYRKERNQIVAGTAGAAMDDVARVRDHRGLGTNVRGTLGSAQERYATESCRLPLIQPSHGNTIMAIEIRVPSLLNLT